jgi:hypothetical protein
MHLVTTVLSIGLSASGLAGSQSLLRHGHGCPSARDPQATPSPNRLRNDPLRVLAIASRPKFHDGATLAMKLPVYHPLIVPRVSEPENIPAAALHNYLRCRSLCADWNILGNVWGEFAWSPGLQWNRTAVSDLRPRIQNLNDRFVTGKHSQTSTCL